MPSQSNCNNLSNSHTSLLCRIQARVRESCRRGDGAYDWFDFDVYAAAEAERFVAAGNAVDPQFEYRVVSLTVVAVLELEEEGVQVVRAALASYIQQLEVWCAQPLASEQHVSDLKTARQLMADLWTG